MAVRVTNPFPLADAPRVWFWIKDLRHRLFDDTVPGDPFAFTDWLVGRLRTAAHSWAIYDDGLMVGLVFAESAAAAGLLLTCLFRPESGGLVREGLHTVMAGLFASGMTLLQCPVFGDNKAVMSMLVSLGARRTARFYGQVQRGGRAADVDMFTVSKEAFYAVSSSGSPADGGRKRNSGRIDESGSEKHEHQHEHANPDIRSAVPATN